MQIVNYLIHCIPPHENRKMEGGVRERHQKISGELGNLKKTKMAPIDEGNVQEVPTRSEVILKLPSNTYYRSNK